MVFLDIDDVLLKPAQSFGSEAWFRKHVSEFGLDETLKLYHCILKQTDVELVEPDAPFVVDRLQKMPQVIVVGLTSRQPEYNDITEQQLKTVGIDLKKNQGLSLPEIFYTGGGCKGQMAARIIKDIERQGILIHQVRMIDDDKSKIDAVLTSVKSLGKNFHGFRYNRLDHTHFHDQAITALQKKYWQQPFLSDNEAKAILAMQNRHDLPDNLLQSVVLIGNTKSVPPQTTEQTQASIQRFKGSGVVIEWPKGQYKILTCCHVVEDAAHLEIRLAAGGESYSATCLAYCRELDVAILDCQVVRFKKHAKPLEVGGMLGQDTPIESAGFPIGGQELSYSRGRIIRHAYVNTAMSDKKVLMYQFDAAASFGSSGGPLLHQGRVIGICLQALIGAPGTAYALPASYIILMLSSVAQMKNKDREIRLTPCDLQWQPLINSNLRNHFGLEHEQGGVLLKPSKVQLGKGIQPNDILVAIEGHHISCDGMLEKPFAKRIPLAYLFDICKAGKPLELTILRQGKTITLAYTPELQLKPLEQMRQLIVNGIFFVEVESLLIKRVYLSSFLPCDEHIGYDEICNVPVSQINDHLITCLEDVIQSFACGQNFIIKSKAHDVAVVSKMTYQREKELSNRYETMPPRKIDGVDASFEKNASEPGFFATKEPKGHEKLSSSQHQWPRKTLS